MTKRSKPARHALKLSKKLSSASKLKLIQPGIGTICRRTLAEYSWRSSSHRPRDS